MEEFMSHLDERVEGRQKREQEHAMEELGSQASPIPSVSSDVDVFLINLEGRSRRRSRSTQDTVREELEMTREARAEAREAIPASQGNLSRPELANLVRQQLLDRRPYSALNTMAKLPNFQQPLARFVHRQIQGEAFKARHSLSRGAAETFTRKDLEDFNIPDHYGKLLTHCPLLMASLFGGSSRQKYKAIQVTIIIHANFNTLIFLLPLV